MMAVARNPSSIDTHLSFATESAGLLLPLPGRSCSALRMPLCESGELKQVIRLSGAESDDVDWAGYPFEFLIVQVFMKQHAWIDEELARLQKQAGAITQLFGLDRREPNLVRRFLAALASKFVAHLTEEDLIFPWLLDLELSYTGEYPVPGYPRPLREVLRGFPQQHTLALQQIYRRCVNAESQVCSPRVTTADHDLWNRLKGLLMTVMDHVCMEDKVLFSRAAQMEVEIFGRSDLIRR